MKTKCNCCLAIELIARITGFFACLFSGFYVGMEIIPDKSVTVVWYILPSYVANLVIHAIIMLAIISSAFNTLFPLSKK